MEILSVTIDGKEKEIFKFKVKFQLVTQMIWSSLNCDVDTPGVQTMRGVLEYRYLSRNGCRWEGAGIASPLHNTSLQSFMKCLVMWGGESSHIVCLNFTLLPSYQLPLSRATQKSERNSLHPEQYPQYHLKDSRKKKQRAQETNQSELCVDTRTQLVNANIKDLWFLYLLIN